jgi:putative aldouronate transport system permease protein
MIAKRKNWFDYLNIFIMLLIVFVTLYPIYYVAVVSLSDGISVARGEVYFFPHNINLQAYKVLLSDPAIQHAYGNTLLYTVLGTCVNILMTTLCAYPLSRRNFYGRASLSLFVVFTLFFDGGLIPRYMVVHSLGMINQIWAVLIPTAINVFNMILMRTFFEEIPDALHESATVDGAGEWKILYKIILPLSLPVMATMVLFYSVAHWNSFFHALIYFNHKSLYPLQILLRNIVIDGDLTSQSTDAGAATVMAQNLKYAFVMVAIVPILVVYPFVQKYFVQGAMLGSVKG